LISGGSTGSSAATSEPAVCVMIVTSCRMIGTTAAIIGPSPVASVVTSCPIACTMTGRIGRSCIKAFRRTVCQIPAICITTGITCPRIGPSCANTVETTGTIEANTCPRTGRNACAAPITCCRTVVMIGSAACSPRLISARTDENPDSSPDDMPAPPPNRPPNDAFTDARTLLTVATSGSTAGPSDAHRLTHIPDADCENTCSSFPMRPREPVNECSFSSIPSPPPLAASVNVTQSPCALFARVPSDAPILAPEPVAVTVIPLYA
jgi:hypothetical protein